MELNPGIFKAYDIRGIYGEQMDEETAQLTSGAPSSGCWPGCGGSPRASCGSASAATCG